MAEIASNAIASTATGHYGAAGTGVSVRERTIAAAWNVQGDPSRALFTDAVREAFGLALPLAPNTLAVSGPLTAFWLGPTSWLLVAGGASRLSEFAAKRDLLNARGGALFDQTAGRVAWTISGPHATAVLASGCPLDFHPRAFPAGTCAQSVLWHVNALIARPDVSPTFTVMVARSLARDAWHAFSESAAQYGYEVLSPGLSGGRGGHDLPGRPRSG